MADVHDEVADGPATVVEVHVVEPTGPTVRHGDRESQEIEYARQHRLPTPARSFTA